MSDELDGGLRRLAAQLREPVPVDAEALARVKAAVRARAPRRRLARLLHWLTGPRLVRVSPVRLGAALSAVALAGLLAGRAIAPDPRPAPQAAAPVQPASVQFLFVAEDARSVVVVGDFNDWDAAATPLRPVGAGGVWTATLPLPRGRYVYSFIVDGTEWVRDPAAPPAPEDDFGHPNSVLLVTGRQM